MPTFLIEHLDNCTPLSPCASCQALGFLREKLKIADFNEFLMLVAKGTGKMLPEGKTSDIDMSLPWQEVLPDLPSRLWNGLLNDGHKTIGDVLKLTRYQITRIPNVGRRSADHLEEYLAAKGLKLADRPEK